MQPLLDDPVWFVRLQAAKAVAALRHCSAPALLAKRLTDDKWQVRNAAATAIVRAAADPAGIFLETLDATDRYAKESICEEIQKTGFVYRLIGELESPDGAACAKSRKILDIMASLGYGSPLEETLKGRPGGRIGEELKTPVEAGAAQ